jgi:hypothetical protein
MPAFTSWPSDSEPPPRVPSLQGRRTASGSRGCRRYSRFRARIRGRRKTMRDAHCLRRADRNSDIRGSNLKSFGAYGQKVCAGKQAVDAKSATASVVVWRSTDEASADCTVMVAQPRGRRSTLRRFPAGRREKPAQRVVGTRPKSQSPPDHAQRPRRPIHPLTQRPGARNGTNCLPPLAERIPPCASTA